MRRALIGSAVALTLALAAAASRTGPAAATLPNDDKTIVHVLNRVGFGPRPGDVAKVREIGVQRYIEEQLRPERVADPGMNERLAGLQTITMSTGDIVRQFELPQIEMRRERQLQAQRGTTDGADTRPPQPPAVTPEMQRRNQQVVMDLSQQKMLRAIYSERQLQEVLADFWFNHFNVDARKGRDRFLLTEYERDAIRPHVLGKFRDLLEATAKSPAVLFYLDNWQSVDPNGPHPAAGGRQAPFGRGRFGAPLVPRRLGRQNQPVNQPPNQMPNQPPNQPRRGLNENYGRELMELHTLGVDGGYTQKDVTEVARAFTGWTIDNPRQGGSGGYRFDPRMHDPGEKMVLGHRIKAGGGERDGEEVLDILATHTSTARFISTKLARRFVSDNPPAALLDRAAAKFLDTGGDIREVMRTILTSPEFFAADAYRAKVKTPFEFVVSAVRATGTELTDATPLVRALQQLGMPLYQCQPPTGYKDTADAWVNTGSLVARMNFALTLASRQSTVVSRQSESTVAVDNQTARPDPATYIDRLLNGDVSESTRATIAKATTPPQMAALTLGSPEFQRK